jgi:hypothetical protein
MAGDARFGAGLRGKCATFVRGKRKGSSPVSVIGVNIMTSRYELLNNCKVSLECSILKSALAVEVAGGMNVCA